LAEGEIPHDLTRWQHVWQLTARQLPVELKGLAHLSIGSGRDLPSGPIIRIPFPTGKRGSSVMNLVMGTSRT